MNSNESAPLHVCSVRMCFPSKNVEQMIVLLESVTGITCSKHGCLFCSVSRDVGDADWVYYMEMWNDRLAFEQHVRSEAFHRVLVAMDQCREEPEVISGSLAGQVGMASLQALHESRTDLPNG
jgi:quinol monooxygenase YgiN